MRGAAFLLRGLYLVPVPVSFCLPDPRGRVPWHQARRDPTGLSPDPAVTQEAVIQVFAAPAVAWRGLFSVHTWIAVKPAGAPRFTRYEVLGWCRERGTGGTDRPDGTGQLLVRGSAADLARPPRRGYRRDDRAGARRGG